MPNKLGTVLIKNWSNTCKINYIQRNSSLEISSFCRMTALLKKSMLSELKVKCFQH